MSQNYLRYDTFYLDRNKATPGRYDKHCRGFEKNLSPVLKGLTQKRALDIGCGCGFLVYFLKKFGFQNVTGVDLNEQLIAVAKSNVDAAFVVADAFDYLKSKPACFDIIFLWNLLEHIPRQQVAGFLGLVHDALADTGFAVVRTPNMTNLMAQGHFCDDFTHISPFTEQSITQVANLAGFRAVEMLNQFKMQNFKGKLKAAINFLLHRSLLWLRGGTKPSVFYRNLYLVLRK